MRFQFSLSAILMAMMLARGLSAAPPQAYLNEAGTRIMTVEPLDEGRVRFTLRNVSEPGSTWNEAITGQQTPKGIEFSLKAGEGDPAGPVYLATASATRLTVKLKSGQTGVQDVGLAGVYRHVTDEKITQLAKKNYEAALKKMDEAVQSAARKAPPEDKPAYAEWKKAWPALRERLFALAGPKSAAQAANQATAESAEKSATHWMQRAGVITAATNFISWEMPKGLKAGWEGGFEDGFGGTIEMIILSNGDARFTINASRGGEGMGGMIEGGLPASMLKTAKDGAHTGEFIEKNTRYKEAEQPARLRFRRIGHFLIVESHYAERYAGRGWFDGIYMMRSSLKEE